MGPLKERLVLAVLLLYANEFVLRERLIDELWRVALSKLMGHANPRVTLDVYSHLYDRERLDEAVREAMG